MRWFGRDPALVISGAVALLIMIIHLAPLNEPATGAFDGLAAAIGGAVVAMVVTRDGQLPAILGVIKGALYLGVVWGWHITDAQQGLILAAVESVVALVFIRPNVEAPVTEQGTWRMVKLP